ncbi:MAG: T9SS type A sorting domain-containing protein [Bacteroidota bacterium]|nr:T9SS type A sorting domain-containing protein [Bacteroidota bacterium]
MKKHLLLFKIIFCFGIFYSNTSGAQNCNLLNASITTYESRCAATGSIKILVSGGSGSYKFKTIGPVNSNFTTSDSITGLSAGIYSVEINDIISNCTLTKTGIVVSGSYEDPRFTLNSVDVSCDNGNNGSISVNGLQYGRSPFTYTIVAPSPMGVGITSANGYFPGLKAGDYSIRLTDSCGGIQTRTVTINNYTWSIDSYQFTKISCDSATGYIKVIDSKNNISTEGGIPGFTYGVVTQAGDTAWSSDATFAVGVYGINSIDVFARDSCGNIKKVTLSLFLVPSVDAAVTISNKVCNTFTASVTGVSNFLNPDFCLYDSNDVKLVCNSTGLFNNIHYGRYCIKTHDACTDTTISRCFNITPPVISIADDVIITNNNCNTFDVAVTGQVGLTDPFYILSDGNGVFINSDSSGVFSNLAYGDYCIATKDGCRDTTITRCFLVKRPIPIIPDVILPSYVNCVNFGIEVGGDSLTLPTYCLYDTSGAQISCNSTGIFDSIPLGSYCVTIHDACIDTTITRCFDVGSPTIINDLSISVTNKTCSTFTATATTSNFNNAEFCLYNSADVLIYCDSTGIFNNLSYGTYCLKSKNACPDTTVVNCFTVGAPIPSVNSSVSLSNYSCTSFSAQVKGQQNLTNPEYCIIDASNDTVACNNTGKFDNLLYGSYCIQIVNSCPDTTIQICFTKSAGAFNMSAHASKSCNYGFSKFNISFSGTILPVNVKIYDPGDSLMLDNNYSSNNITVDNMPDLAVGLSYTIIATDNCGNKDTIQLSPVIGYLNHAPQVITKCPGSAWINGSGNIQTSVVSNMGSLTVRIIKKDGNNLSPQLNPDFVTDSVYLFNDLGPGSYILRYKANDGCNVYIYDTVTVPVYQYPNLERSSAYQCDINGFSVGVVASNGVGPFTYEIIGSTPSTPSIIAGPQSDPVFNIDNGTDYSLIRLRALDACGNATLSDASVLPLANNGIIASFNCFEHPTTLKVDTIFNSTYSWYKKDNVTSTDSIFIGSGFNYYIPSLTPIDTGIYLCHIMVNNGCVNRYYYYHLNGDCYTVLPVMLVELSGKFINENVQLNWSITNGEDLKNIIVERKNTNNIFIEIGNLNAGLFTGLNQYQYIDSKSGDQNFYRLKLLKNDNSFTYTNIIFLKKISNSGIIIYPNPAKDILNIDFIHSNNHVYKITLMDMLNQKIKEIVFKNENGNKLQIRKTKNISSGIYILRFIDKNTNEEFSQKVIFRND